MEIKDLDQRYTNTYIPWKGKIEYCNGFETSARGGTTVFIKTDNPDDYIREKFSSAYLNTYRPDARWLNPKHPLFVYHMAKRQWQRGFTFGKNYYWMALTKNGKEKETLQEWFYGAVDPILRGFTLEKLWSAIGNGATLILSPLIVAFKKQEDQIAIYYRRTQIAACGHEELWTTDDRWITELKEIFPTVTPVVKPVSDRIKLRVAPQKVKKNFAEAVVEMDGDNAHFAPPPGQGRGPLGAIPHGLVQNAQIQGAMGAQQIKNMQNWQKDFEAQLARIKQNDGF